MGFASLRTAIYNATDVSYGQPPSPPTTGARASTNMPHVHASCPCLLLAVACCWFAGSLVVLTVYSPFHSQADLLWLSCAGTAGQAPDSTPPGSDAEGQTPQPEVGSTGRNPPQSRRPASSRASRGLYPNPGQEECGNESSIQTTWQLVCAPLLRGVPV